MHESHLELHILAASTTLSRVPGLLTARQFQAYTLAYVHDVPIGRLARTLKTSPRGATETLKRTAKKLESALMRRLADLPCSETGHLIDTELERLAADGPLAKGCGLTASEYARLLDAIAAVAGEEAS